MEKRYAVLIGIDDNDIKGCSNDVKDIRSMLETIYHIPSRNIVTITREIQNELSPEMKLGLSIRKKIMDSIAFLLEKKEDISQVWFHVSSHGKQIAYDGSSIFKIGEDKYISSKWITRELSKLPKSCKILMTFDYCHSGYYHQLPYMYETHPRGMIRRTVKINPKVNEEDKDEIHPRMFCIASTSDGYSSDVLYKEADGFRGAFTSALLDGLKHHRYNVELPTLFKTIQKIIQLRKHDQKPRLFSSSMDPYSFIL